MKNPSGKKLEKLVFGMFDQMVEGADKYVTKQGSTWLIFTEDKRWVIEFTNDKTLWFNYNVFQSELDLINKDCTEERDLIKSWFESRFLNKPKVEETLSTAGKPLMVEDAIQEGVRHTKSLKIYRNTSEIVEDAIQEGAKNTTPSRKLHPAFVEDTIQNGVKETTPSGYLGSIEMKGKIVHQIESPKQNNEVEDTIQNGVKDTLFGVDPDEGRVEDAIQNGVKDIIDPFWVDPVRIKDVIQNGVKEILEERTEETWFVDDVIQDGVKEIKSDKGYLPHFGQQYKANQTIENGVKDTKEDRLFRTISVISTIKNGVKHVEDGDWLDQDERVDDIIESGVKEIIPSTFESEEQKDHWKTNDEITESIKDVIENGVKETKEMKHNRNRYHGHFILKDDIPTYIPMVQVQDVIENGVKEVKEISNISLMSEIFKVNANRAIRDGVKELKELPDKSGEFRGYGDYYHRQEDITKPHTEYVKEVIEDSYNHMGRVEGVIRNTDKDGI